MTDSKYILFFFGCLGAFNGIVFGIWLIIRSRKKQLSDLFLGSLLLALSIRIGKSVFVFFNPDLAKIYLQLGLSACLFIGPALYFYTRSAMEQITEIPRSWKWQIGLLLAAIVLVGGFAPYPVYPEFWGTYIIRAIYTVWLVYVVATLVKLWPVMVKSVKRAVWKKLGLQKQEKWLLTIVLANVVIFTTFFLSLVGRQCQLYLSGSLIFTFVLYAVALWVMYKKKEPVTVQAPPPPKYANKKVEEGEAKALLARLDQLMVEQELYKNTDLTLAELAASVAVSSHQLSQVLNDNLGKNFTFYINEYRIKKACAMIAGNHPFSLEAIGYEVGFNSKSTFYTAFRKVMATTPALYKEGLEKMDTI
ncbi:helix-turn-helix domain-containing protein [Paraflavitalea pollutisoli]|uniref:helix-turn-helix domain-containing protein n=1 Tax=Paraflavitalea pollutisoli TaxID=3034143 RepID=UPI0023EC39C7|nr:helix-turn-helix domain-containing protein [Paraflavitalea sp. H1-2-19X]